MKILSAEQLKKADQITVTRQHISSLDLMERASKALFEQITQDFAPFKGTFILICGTGNNGGDGLALGRMLAESGRSVNVLLLDHNNYSKDNQANQERLLQMNIPIERFDLSSRLPIPEHAIIIDALYGLGLSRPLHSTWHTITEQINTSPNPVVSIDLPSGLLADRHSEKKHPIIQAERTYTLQCPKLSLLLPENALYTGEVTLLDIQLDHESLLQADSDYYYLQMDNVRSFIPKHNRYAHKGTFGHIMIAGGSYGKIGAIVLSSRAALKTGCGLVTTYIPKCGYDILQTAFPEAMVITDDNEKFIQNFPEELQIYSALGIGMGMGTNENSQQTFMSLIKNIATLTDRPHLVLDADALNILSYHPDWLPMLPPNSILTPHPKELQRLIGPWQNDFEKLEKTQAFSAKYQVITLIKGANTNIVLPNGKIYFNSTGNWGMATGGSGDVLTGIITSLLAQGLQPQHAAITGVFLHGLAGDLALRTTHPKSLVASDIVEHISDAWRSLTGN